jgi:hypothetical protein
MVLQNKDARLVEPPVNPTLGLIRDLLSQK